MKSDTKWLVTTHAIDRWRTRVDDVNDEEARYQLLQTVQIAHLFGRTSNGHILLNHNYNSKIVVYFVISIEIDNAFRIITVFTKEQFKNPRNYDPKLDILALNRKIKSVKDDAITKQLEIPEVKKQSQNIPEVPKSQNIPEVPRPSRGWVYKSFVYNVLDILVTTRNLDAIYMAALSLFPERLEELARNKRIIKQLNKEIKSIYCENLDPDILM